MSDFPQSDGMMSGISGPSQTHVSQTHVTQTGQPTYYDQAGKPGQGTTRQKTAIDSAESAKMTPQILFLLIGTGLKRTWKWAFPLGVVMAAATFTAMYLFFPIQYEASAWIRVLTSKPRFVFTDQDSARYDHFIATQLQTIKGPLILDKALENPEVARLPIILKQKDKRFWITKYLQSTRLGGSEVIVVSILTEAAKDAEIIVNAVITAYFEDYTTRNNALNAQTLTQLNLELARQQSAARLLQDEIRRGVDQAAGKGGVAGEGGGMTGGMNPGDSIQRDLFLAESRLEGMRAERDMLKETLEGEFTIPQTILSQAMLNDPVLRTLQTRLEETRASVENQRKLLPRPDDPKILNLQDQIKAMEKQISERMGDTSGASFAEDIQRSYRVNWEQQLWTKEMEIRSMEIMVKNLQNKYKEQIANAQSRTGTITDVTFAQEQLRRVNNVLDLLQTRVVSLETEKNAPEQVQLLRKASIPLEPKVKNRIPLASMGAAVGFFVPFILGIAVERLKPRLYHVSQIRRGIPSVLIGEIMEPPVAWIHGPTFRKRLARYRESVHNWCTHLLLSEPFRRCKTLSVASVSGDDGKTFLAVQVAVAMAQMKSGPVLLIDADMRVGRLHLLFGNEETGIGLADVLSFRNGFGEAVVLNEREPNLHLLSAGQLDVSPYELLGDGRFRELLDTLESHYSLIIVVLPPVANAAESLMMAASTDSTLLCVRQGETVLAAMEDVFRKIDNTGGSVDAIVVKDIPYYQMAGKDGGFADKLEQIRLAHLLQYAD